MNVWIWFLLAKWCRPEPYVIIIISKKSQRNLEEAVTSQWLDLIFNYCLCWRHVCNFR